MDIILHIVSIIFFIYNIYVIYHIGLPESVSATSYFFLEKHNKPYIFTLMSFLLGITILPAWLTISPENWQFLAFLTVGGILFAGATPLFRSDFEKPIHYTSGILLLLTYITWFIVTGNYDMLLLTAILCFFGIIHSPQSYVYIFEVIGYYILNGYLINQLN